MSCHCQAETCHPSAVCKEWSWLGVGLLLLLSAVLLPLPKIFCFLLFVAAYLCCGVEVLLTSFHNVRKGEFFDENF